ncbi:hypothetical protein BJ742DRAFT_743175 [Cladochytrium replicatum]|nr:hypothetical protein BJ742DRAFT_743175 [Cladochytrium replicatum]
MRKTANVWKRIQTQLPLPVHAELRRNVGVKLWDSIEELYGEAQILRDIYQEYREQSDENSLSIHNESFQRSALVQTIAIHALPSEKPWQVSLSERENELVRWAIEYDGLENVQRDVRSIILYIFGDGTSESLTAIDVSRPEDIAEIRLRMEDESKNLSKCVQRLHSALEIERNGRARMKAFPDLTEIPISELQALSRKIEVALPEARLECRLTDDSGFDQSTSAHGTVYGSEHGHRHYHSKPLSRTHFVPALPHKQAQPIANRQTSPSVDSNSDLKNILDELQDLEIATSSSSHSPNALFSDPKLAPAPPQTKPPQRTSPRRTQPRQIDGDVKDSLCQDGENLVHFVRRRPKGRDGKKARVKQAGLGFERKVSDSHVVDSVV